MLIHSLRQSSNKLFLRPKKYIIHSVWKEFRIELPTSRVKVLKAHSNDIPKILKLLRGHIHQHNPIFEAVAQPIVQFCPIFDEFWRYQIQQNLTWLAYSNAYRNRSIPLGVVINTNLLPWDPDYWESFAKCIKCKKTKILIKEWTSAMKKSALYERVNHQKLFNINHIVINEIRAGEHHSGLNIFNLSRLLIEQSLNYAENDGYKMACFICNNKILEDVAISVGMDLIWKQYSEANDFKNSDNLAKINIPSMYIKSFTKRS